MKKKIFSLFLIFIMIISLMPITVYANENVNYYARYSGSTQASYGYKPNCTFTINKIVNDKFRGRFAASNLGNYSFDEVVEGNVYSGINSFTCTFTVKFYNDRYYSNIIATVNKIEGTCECFCVGSWHMEDFVMTGTKFNYPTGFGVNSGFNSYSETDMKICMALSDAIYGNKKTNPLKNIKNVNDRFKNVCAPHDLSVAKNELIFYNLLDSDLYNAPFAITRRVNDDGSIDIFVIIRGTLKDEWQGNTEITGTSYDQDKIVHDNFNKAKDSIKTAIELYYRDIAYRSDEINLIISGHSRGAAVANLYAKEATDAQTTTADCGIPHFSNVTAYTFACPNVEKYNSTMEGYTNIFNFCFKEDLVATVPLTNPTEGWNYWKYGQTYVGNLSEYNNQINKNAVSDIHNAFSGWKNVKEYYDSYITILPSFTTLYKLAHDATGAFMSYSLTPRRCMDSFKFISDLAMYDNRTVGLLCRAIINGKSIVTAHDYVTYNSVINGTMASSSGDDIFFHCSYDSLLEETKTSNYSSQLNNDMSVAYSLNDLNSSDILQLTTFANYDDNLSILGWNIDDPSTWQGVNWDASGNVESIDFSYMNLEGSLDLSNFTSLKSLNISGNNLTSINLTNCSSLVEVDCSFNKLTDLDLSSCTNLSSLTCCYNYLDTHEGGTLYNTFDDLMFNDCYVNYYPQSVPDNAVFNTTELNALKTFANTANNNSELDWLDDSGNIDTQKLQNNVLFEYDGSKHRVVAIDIADTNVSGTLNLTSLSLLQELYCENTKITTLNVNGCTKLGTLQCDGCELTTLTLPSNASTKTSSLYDVSCEYNYLDTSIFTQNIINYIEFKAGGKIEYLNQKGEDSSALQAAISFANTLDKNDYSSDSFEELNNILEECNYYNFDNLYLTQNDIDDLTSEILTAIYDLKAYFDVKVSAPNGSLSIAYDDKTSSDSGTYSILYGTTVTLNATADNDYTFVGWYDTTSNRYLSNDVQYSFKVDSNINLKAVIIPNGSATLTFANYSNWIAGTVTKTTTEWTELTSIEDLLPNVPYRYGYSNGRWVYDDSAVLALLQSGQDVNIGAEYDEDNASFPTPRVAVDKPVLDLYYNYDSNNTVGSFVMAAGFPDGIQVESVGIAFYYKKANQFDPTDNFTLLLNNKMLVGRFNTDVLEDIYITNMNKMTSTYNWAARGYVTYYDENNNLVTAYSNQINVVDTRNADEIPVDTFSLPEVDLNDDAIHKGIEVLNGEDD